MLTGKQIWNHRIIDNGLAYKQDDGKIPSYGLDGMLYTFAISVDWQFSTLSPMQFRVFKTLETVRMPDDCGGLLTIKSTYGRQGVILTTNSPVDPGYVGALTVGLFNCSDEIVMLYGHGGFMQMTVHRLEEKTELKYEGRWMNG